MTFPRNALSAQVLTDLTAVLDHARSDVRVSVLVITGAADKAFIAGADITQLQHYTPSTALESAMQRGFEAIEDFPKGPLAVPPGQAGRRRRDGRLPGHRPRRGALRANRPVRQRGQDRGAAAFLGKRTAEFEGR